MSGKKSNFGLKALLTLTQHPVLASVTAVLVVSIANVIFNERSLSFLSILGIDQPTSDQIAVLSLIFAIAVASGIGYLVHSEKQKRSLSRKVDFLVQENNSLRMTNEKLLTDDGCSVPKEVGLTGSWKNFNEARIDIRQAILDTNAREISILIHCETELVDGGQGVIGYAFEQLALRRREGQPRQVRVLFPAKNNPHYTDPEYGLKHRAQQRRMDRDAFSGSEDEYVRTRIERFTTKHDRMVSGLNKYKSDGLANVLMKEHAEPYLWNLIFIDGQVFAQCDVYKNCLQNSPVLRFEDLEIADSLSRTHYYVFKKYFEKIWNCS